MSLTLCEEEKKRFARSAALLQPPCETESSLNSHSSNAVGSTPVTASSIESPSLREALQPSHLQVNFSLSVREAIFVPVTS